MVSTIGVNGLQVEYTPVGNFILGYLLIPTTTIGGIATSDVQCAQGLQQMLYVPNGCSWSGY